MLLTPHTLVGIAVATMIRNPLIAVPVSFGLHFVGDMVPHWDFYTGTLREERVRGWRPIAVMADLALGVAVGVSFTLYALWVLNNPGLAVNILLCGVAGVMPDVLTGPSLYLKDSKKLFEWVHSIQSRLQTSAPLIPGVLTQVFVSAFSLVLIANSIKL